MDDIQRAIEVLRLEDGLEISGKPRRVAEFCGWIYLWSGSNMSMGVMRST